MLPDMRQGQEETTHARSTVTNRDVQPTITGEISAYRDALTTLLSFLLSDLPPALPRRGDVGKSDPGGAAASRRDNAASIVLRMLVARDNLARLLTRQALHRPETVQTIADLDHTLRLEVNRSHIVRLAGARNLRAWRQTMRPPASAWWWSLDDPATAVNGQPNPAWVILAALFLTVSLSFTVDISRRFLAVGPDVLATFTTLFQGLLTILAGTTLLEIGRRGVENALTRLGVTPRLHQILVTPLAFMVLLVVLALYATLPAAARYYNNQGLQAERAGQVTSAIASYQRALSLNPDYAAAHYNLGDAYETTFAYDKALSEYKTAILLDSQFYLAYNSLGHLDMAYQNDFASAWLLLDKAAQMSIALPDAEQKAVRYTIYKNLAWANLGLHRYTDAEQDLQQALGARPTGAAAHCLLPQVWVAEGKTDATTAQQATAAWQACLDGAQEEYVEPQWLRQAHEQLAKGGSH